jgi:hypothetical protein
MEMRNAYINLLAQRDGKKSLGRPRGSYEDSNIKGLEE